MLGNFDFDVISRSWVYLFQTGMVFTLKLTALAMVGGIVLGTLLALMRLSSNRLISGVASSYVNLIRSIPLVLVIFWFYFLVPYIAAWVIGANEPVKVGAFSSALITFIMFEAAYYCEIMRSGIQSIPRGQVWAGQALGMNYRQTMGSIVLPQAFRNMIPVLLTQTIRGCTRASSRTCRSCTCCRSPISSAPPRKSRSATAAWWKCMCLWPSCISCCAMPCRSW